MAMSPIVDAKNLYSCIGLMNLSTIHLILYTLLLINNGLHIHFLHDAISTLPPVDKSQAIHNPQLLYIFSNDDEDT